MARRARHFTVTKHIPRDYGSIEFSGIVYRNDPEQYDIDDVRFHIAARGQNITEDITQFFRMYRETTDPEFHHEDICELLAEWLVSDEARVVVSRES